MIMKLVQSILTKNPCYTAGRKITVKGLMLHSVGCPQPKASVFINSWNSPSYGNACVHGFIDGNDGTVYQTLPWNHRGWHCGSGSKGSGNNTHIGVEMCEPACIKYTSGANFTCSDLPAARAVAERTYQAAAKNAAAAASKTAAAHSATTAGLKGAAGGGLKAVAGAFGGLLAPLLGILLVVVFIAVLGGASGSSTQQQNQVSLNGLSGVQLEVATALSQAGYGPVQIASIMGNIQGESGWDPTVGDASSGYGLYQFTGSSYTAFANWCDANGKQKDSATAQTEYIASNLQGLWGTALHESGYYGAITDYAGKDVSYEAWQSSTDVGFATYAFMACYERPRSDVAPSSFTEDRLPAAQQFYALLTGGAGGLGEDYANADETGKAIVNAALVTPWPGADLCATWVSHVYQQAGLGYPTGNGNSILAGYATSSDWANIKVGQIISAQYGSGSAGAIYGHTGIYIGDGKVMDSISSGIRTSSLTDWIAENGRGWVVYGWPW